jgi:hypothetical protein
LAESEITPEFDSARQIVRGADFTISAAGQHIREDVYLHIYSYEDKQSRFYFVVERLKRSPAPATEVWDTGICDVKFIGYQRDRQPGYQRSEDLSADQKRSALVRIQAGMKLMEIPTYGPPKAVRISAT